MDAKENVLYELAQAMATTDGHSAAVALRKLAQAGYSSLDEVDSASDWTLLSIPGLGVGRLGAVRRLTRLDWQPPSPQAVKAVSRFVSTAQVARRFWPPETLMALIQGSAPVKVAGGPVERRLALDVFYQAVRRALSYCAPQELIQILRPTGNGSRPGCVCQDPELRSGREVQIEGIAREPQSELGTETPGPEPRQDDPLAESDRYAYSPRKRRKIVEHYRAVRDRGLIENKDRWAQSNYNITGRTLLNYEREFPEEEERIR
jgi:hypothetical protein